MHIHNYEKLPYNRESSHIIFQRYVGQVLQSLNVICELDYSNKIYQWRATFGRGCIRVTKIFF